MNLRAVQQEEEKRRREGEKKRKKRRREEEEEVSNGIKSLCILSDSQRQRETPDYLFE